MKVIEIANTDFALRHFVLPLMRGLRARGHEVIGASADGAMHEVVRAEGFRVEALPLQRKLSLLAHWHAFWAIVRFLRAEKPDLVHGHMPISGFLARLAARVAGVERVAYTCHGYHFNKPGPWWIRTVSYAMEVVGGQLTDVHMTVSREEAADSRRFGINRGSVAIGNGRDPTRFRADAGARARIRAELGVAKDAVVVTMMARLVRHKGLPELLEAMANVPAELWVVGERLASDHGEDLAPYLANSALGNRLRCLGTREDVPAILAASDIFALPSHFEGLPMSIIEAMLVGLPVVSTDIRGPREQVLDGQTGFLVPPFSIKPLADALRQLAEDAGLRERMGEAGRARALAEFDEAVVMARTLDLLGA